MKSIRLIIPLLLLASCTTAHAIRLSLNAVPSGSHIIVVIMENKEYSNIIGSSAAPFVNSFAKANSLATAYYANFHPSEPNYLAMIFGSNMGVKENDEGRSIKGLSLADQINAAGLSWRGYFENMPRDVSKPCLFRSSGRYRKKHNPMALSANVNNNSVNCAKMRVVSDLINDQLANFSLIVPNMCNDTHDCSVRTGDNWLKSHIPSMLSKLTNPDLLILTWDEGNTSKNHIATIVAGPGAKKLNRSSVHFNHYSLLRTIQQRLGIPCLRHSCDSTVKAMTSLLI